MFKKDLSLLLSKELKEDKKEIYSLIQRPLIYEHGDYSFPCFFLSKKLKKSPKIIAQELAKKIKSPFLSEIKPLNGYLNFYIKKEKLANKTIKEILDKKQLFGTKKQSKQKKVVIESPGPNTNKPLHLGHARNMALNICLSNLFKATGNKVVNVDIINDRGIHIAKSMLAYKKFGKNKNPNKKEDHFVGDFYVLYDKEEKKNPKIKEELSQFLISYENNNKETVNLLKKMNAWAIKGINETYKRFGVNINKTYYETEHYKKGRSLILKNLKKGIFQKEEDGSISIDLTKEKLDKKTLLRSDGTSLYITQDLYLAVKRHQDYKMDKMIYIVGSEQIYHFKVLFNLLGKMGYKFAKDYYHFPYGMVYLPQGKMKSREGTVVDTDNLLNQTKELAKKEIIKRNPNLSSNELDQRAERISLAAIKFFILKFDALKDFTFDPKKSISFEGETGPYIQYAYARASSILRKTKSPKFDSKILKLKEKQTHILAQELSKYPEIVEKSTKRLKPDLLANYTYSLAQVFSNFYSSVKVLTENKEEREERLLLILATRQVLSNALGLLGISTLEQM